MNQRRWDNLWFPVIVGALILTGVMSGCLAGGQALPAATQEMAAAFAAVEDREVIIFDNSGAVLGDGTVSLYAPTAMKLNGIARIKLEINGIVAEIAGDDTKGPDAPSSPSTSTPLASEVLSVHEIMGATLGGVDEPHFTINATPSNGLRDVKPNGTTTWEWTLRPAGPQAAGTNYLEVLVYYPRELGSGTPINEEVAKFEVTIEVEGPPTPTPTPPPGAIEQLNDTLGPVVGVAGAITAIAGAVGVFYGAYRFLTRRRKKRRK